MLELAREENWEAVNRIAASVSRQHSQWRPDLFRFTEVPYPREYFLEKVKARALFVAKIQNQVVGYVNFYIWQTSGEASVPRKVLSVDDICVDEPYRNRGVGSEMMAELRVLAKAFGCTDLQLTVYPQNDAAVSFYQKCGFSIKSIDMQCKV